VPDDRVAQTGQIHRDVVVVGASAGGVDAIQAMVAGLPPEFPASLLVVVHRTAAGPTVLPQILARHAALPVAFARDGEPLERGQIYVAPSDRHLLVHDDRVRLSSGPRENGHRPAIDPLFRSAARSAGPRTIGVILSGLLDDGAIGMKLVKRLGGAVLVQDPEEARFSGMPLAAIRAMTPDRVAAAADIGRVLCELVEEPVGAATVHRAAEAFAQDLGAEREQAEPDPHDVLEPALWTAVQSLEELADLQRRLARRVPPGKLRDRHLESADEAERAARALRALLEPNTHPAGDAPEIR